MIIAVIIVFWLLYVEFRISDGRHTPALYFLLYMSGLMIICAFLAGVAPFSPAGFFYLAIVSGAFWIGHLSGALVFGGGVDRMTSGSRDEENGEILRILTLPPMLRSLNILVTVGTVAGIMALIALWQAARGAGIQVTSIFDLWQLPGYYSQMRYSSGVEDAEPISVRFLLPVLEAGSVASGLLRPLGATRYQRLFQTLPLIAAFAMTLMTGSRSYFFLNCVWYFGAFIAILCVQGTVFTQLQSPIFLLKAVLLITVAFLFGSAFAILRYIAVSPGTFAFDGFVNQLLPLMASSLEAIVNATLVFDQVASPGVGLHLATYSFAPVMAWLGLESVRYPPNIYLTNGLSDSNQYALVGYLLLDFGPFLTAIIFFMTGFLAAGAVYLVRAGVIAILPLLIAIICVTLFSLIGNFFFYTTHVALFVAMTSVAIIVQWLATRLVQAPA